MIISWYITIGLSQINIWFSLNNVTPELWDAAVQYSSLFKETNLEAQTRVHQTAVTVTIRTKLKKKSAQQIRDECDERGIQYMNKPTAILELADIIYEEDHSKDRRQANLHYGDVKGVVLQGDPSCPNLIAFSVYDAKPVYFLTTAAEKVCWDKNTWSVYDKTQRKKVKINYYQSNIQNFYNFHMNSVDVAC